MTNIPGCFRTQRVASESLLRVSPRNSRVFFARSVPTRCARGAASRLYAAVHHIEQTTFPAMSLGVRSRARRQRSTHSACVEGAEVGETCLGVDTLKGYPPRTTDDPDYEIASLYTGAFAVPEEVRGTFQKLGILEKFRFVQGRSKRHCHRRR